MDNGASSRAHCELPAASSASKRPSEDSDLELLRKRLPKLKATSKRYEQTALHEAARKGDEMRINQLLAAGENIRSLDKHGRTALHIALLREKKAAAELLVNAYSKNEVQDCFGSTPLHLSAEKGYIKIVKKLLYSDVTPHIKNEERLYPLDMAIFRAHVDVAEAIIAACVWKEIKIDFGKMSFSQKHVRKNSLINFYQHCQHKLNWIKHMKIPGIKAPGTTVEAILCQDLTTIAEYLLNDNTKKFLWDESNMKIFSPYTDMFAFKLKMAEEKWETDKFYWRSGKRYRRRRIFFDFRSDIFETLDGCREKSSH